jgi:hypothetical protein
LFSQNNQYHSDYLQNSQIPSEQASSQNNIPSEIDNWDLNITYHFNLPEE